MLDTTRKGKLSGFFRKNVSNLQNKRTIKKLLSSQLSPFSAVVIVLVIAISYAYLDSAVDHDLPTPLTTDDIVSGKDRFITERAKSDMIGLAQIGEKVVGSYENQVLAVTYLRNLLEQIEGNATGSKTVQVDVQTCSGAYFLSMTQGLTNIYFNMVNVIARLSDGNSSSNALLVNCHFDSHPVSPGASDNGVNCAAMMEVLRVLSQSNSTLTYDVIFLFNGAEENPLEGSHGFITNHTWAKDVKAFLNYDSAGYGGREALFQVGPNNPWLSAYYASAVPHPFGNSIITDIFSSGIVPSSTDFRIYRDFGGIPGMDMAQNSGGYVYHTSFDDYHIVPDGTLQHTGDNMLALVKALANAPELSDTASYASGDAVFYDFFGLFLIRYSTTVAIVINVCVTLLALFAVYLSVFRKNGFTKTDILINVAGQIIGIFLGVGVAALLGIILDSCSMAMTWYSKPYIIITLFQVPALLPLMIINSILSNRARRKGILGIGQDAQLNSAASSLIWSIVLISLTIYGLKSAYLIALVVGFDALANVIVALLKLQKYVTLWTLIYIFVGLLIPTLYIIWIQSQAYALIPILARSGSQIIPDLYISVINGGLAALIGSLWAPLIGAVKRSWTLICGFFIAALLTYLAIFTSPFGFPYSADPVAPTPQRFWLIHAERTTHDINGNVTYNDGIYWIQNLDRNSPKTVQTAVSELADAVTVLDNCLDAIYCGMPLWKTRDMSMLNKSVWVPAEVPTITETEPSTLIGIWNDTDGESRRLYLNISGPDHMSFFVAPRAGVTLTDWSLLDEIPTANTWRGRTMYFVWYSYGSTPELPWQIWLDLKVPTGISPALDIALNAHYVHNTSISSAPYQTILDKLPVWVTPLYWTSTYKSYIF